MGSLNENDAINILLIILDVANQGADYDNGEKKMTSTRTHEVMYTVLFKHPKMKEFWNVLIDKGLLNFDPNTNRFNTTAEGRIFLKAYRDMDYDGIKGRTTKPKSKRQKQQKIDPLQ